MMVILYGQSRPPRERTAPLTFSLRAPGTASISHPRTRKTLNSCAATSAGPAHTAFSRSRDPPSSHSVGAKTGHTTHSPSRTTSERPCSLKAGRVSYTHLRAHETDSY